MDNCDRVRFLKEKRRWGRKIFRPYVKKQIPNVPAVPRVPFPKAVKIRAADFQASEQEKNFPANGNAVAARVYEFGQR